MSQLAELHEEIRQCQRCGLGCGRTHAVPGEGPETITVMFIGEGPGYHEDKQGRPFVGAAGKFLEELLGKAGLRRDQVYITNVIKCRPPQNRDPLPEEIDACRPFLDRQIELLKPTMIITLGRFSMGRYWAGQSISRIHGQPKKLGNLTLMPMFHPAAALHQPRYRTLIEQDFAKLPALLTELGSLNDRDDEGDEGPPSQQVEQLTLF